MSIEITFCYKRQYYDTVIGDDFDDCENIFSKRHPNAQEITMKVKDEGAE